MRSSPLFGLAVLTSCCALELCSRAPPRQATHIHANLVITRRTLLPAAAALGTLCCPARTGASEEDLATAIFSAGDPRFLQKTFDELRYAGVKRTEVGTLGDVPSIRVTYNANKISYKRVLGAFWRSCDPTSLAQFGGGGPTLIWAASAEEQAVAVESRRRLQRATEFSSASLGPVFKGRPIVTEIEAIADRQWASAANDADQDWYITEPKAFEQARKKSGRTKWFEEAFKPVTVTACERKEGEGAVCGYVYFPCSEENGCKAVMDGAF